MSQPLYTTSSSSDAFTVERLLKEEAFVSCRFLNQILLSCASAEETSVEKELNIIRSPARRLARLNTEMEGE